jgi:hypothetical protein
MKPQGLIVKNYVEFQALWQKLYGKIDNQTFNKAVEAGIINPIYTEQELSKIKNLDNDTLNIIDKAKRTFTQGGIKDVKNRNTI